MIEDAPAVANLYQRFFRNTKAPAAESLVNAFLTVFFRHPWADPELPSLVYAQSDGAVQGFIGVYPVPLCFRGRRIRAAFSGNLMVDAVRQDPLAGARLLRSFLSGRQDLSLTETANQVSLGMFRKLGGQVVVNRSLDWIRIFRPATWLASVGAGRISWLGATRVVAIAVDHLAARALPPPPDVSLCSGNDVAPAELSDVVREISSSFALHPDFNGAVLSFLLEHAVGSEEYGRPLARIVRNLRGQPIGGYLAHGRKNETLRVLQVFASPANADLVVNDLLARAAEMGAAAVTGRMQPELVASVLSASSMFIYRGATVAVARDAELLAAVHGSDNFLNGLAGETWVSPSLF